MNSQVSLKDLNDITKFIIRICQGEDETPKKILWELIEWI